MPKCKRRYKDYKKYRAYLNRHNKKYYAKTALYDPHRYTPDEDELILAHRVTDHELSYQIEHSVKSIQVRRSRLKKKLQEGIKYENY